MRVIVVQPHRPMDDGLANMQAIRRLAERHGICFGPGDLMVLPELVGAELDRSSYVDAIRSLAQGLGTWVVGGSHHHRRAARTVNCGVVADPQGNIPGEYDKINPYGVEADLGIKPGEKVGSFELDGCRVLVLVCADFWSSRLLHRAQCWRRRTRRPSPPPRPRPLPSARTVAPRRSHPRPHTVTRTSQRPTIEELSHSRQPIEAQHVSADCTDRIEAPLKTTPRQPTPRRVPSSPPPTRPRHARCAAQQRHLPAVT